MFEQQIKISLNPMCRFTDLKIPSSIFSNSEELNLSTCVRMRKELDLLSGSIIQQHFKKISLINILSLYVLWQLYLLRYFPLSEQL